MKILLDTHVWIWHLQGSGNLPESLKAILADPQTDLWVSPISAWEAMMLAEKGKIRLEPNAGACIRKALDTGNLGALPAGAFAGVTNKSVIP